MFHLPPEDDCLCVPPKQRPGTVLPNTPQTASELPKPAPPGELVFSAVPQAGGTRGRGRRAAPVQQW